MAQKQLTWDEVIKEISEGLAEADADTLMELYFQCFPVQNIKYDGDSLFTVTDEADKLSPMPGSHMLPDGGWIEPPDKTLDIRRRNKDGECVETRMSGGKPTGEFSRLHQEWRDLFDWRDKKLVARNTGK